MGSRNHNVLDWYQHPDTNKSCSLPSALPRHLLFSYVFTRLYISHRKHKHKSRTGLEDRMPFSWSLQIYKSRAGYVFLANLPVVSLCHTGLRILSVFLM